MSLLLNHKVVDEAIPTVLREIDRSEHPLPYRSFPIFVEHPGREGLGSAISQKERNNALGSRAIHFEVTKPHKGDTRFLHQLSITDTLECHCIALHLAKKSEKLRNDVSFSFRPNTTNKSWQLWEENAHRERWNKWRQAQHQLCSVYPYFLSADIAKFFNNMSHEVLRDAIYRRYEEVFCGTPNLLASLVERLCGLLTGMLPDHAMGLPQGYSASFFFAELPLLGIDYQVDNPMFTINRFVDDFRIMGKTEAHLLRQFEILETFVTDLGFEFNSTKTEVGASQTLKERIEYPNKIHQKYEQATAKLSLDQHQVKIQIALDLLHAELAEGDICRHTVKLLLGILKNELRKGGSVSKTNLETIRSCFTDHRLLAADALYLWTPIFNAAINDAGVQDLLGEIVLDRIDLLDTELAFCYGGFSLAKHIKDASLRAKLVEKFEYDAYRHIHEGTGSEISRVGKALRAAQRHGKGNQILVERFSKNNFYYEMRRYTLAAATRLSDRDRCTFFEAQRRTCMNPEERIVLNYMEAHGEPASPDNYIPSLRMGY